VTNDKIGISPSLDGDTLVVGATYIFLLASFKVFKIKLSRVVIVRLGDSPKAIKINLASHGRSKEQSTLFALKRQHAF
jgi:hypothetical protein